MIKELIKKKDVRVLCKVLFNVELSGKQEDIVKAITYRTHKRLVICAYTRYGKSYAVALGVLLYILFNEDKKILLVAPKYDQTSILRNYIAEFILKSDVFVDLLDLDSTGKERLKKEVSKKRMTFKNGCELRVLSAEGKAERLMGFGGDLIIDDEDCLIDYTVYKQKISRMLGDSPDATMISIGNPWHRDNQMYEHWTDPKYKKVHIDYKTGLKEGRITEEFIEEQRELLSPMEFGILYEAEFPEESEDQLIKMDWIKKAEQKKMKITPKDRIAGCDIAEMGKDKTVLIKGITDGNNYKVENIYSWHKKNTMETAGMIAQKIDKNVKINIDGTGVGSGVAPRLKERGFKAIGIKVGESADKDKRPEEKGRFLNKKAQYYWKLRDLFEQGRIDIPEHHELRKELTSIKYGFTSSEKVKIIRPNDEDSSKKSPDFADALMFFVAKDDKELVFAFV